jgi:hypothetical protein
MDGRLEVTASSDLIQAPSELVSTNAAARTASVIIIGWTLVALAWTPPTILAERGVMPPMWVPLYVFLGFVPWMLATPAFLWLGRRYPITRSANHLWIHAVPAIVIIPLIKAVGLLLSGETLSALHVLPPGYAFNRLYDEVLIDSLYSIPTYIAVVAIIQAVGFLQMYRIRERLLARAQLQALQAQLNPHFLFNTLNAISALGYRDPALADKALTELSQLLRASLADGSAETTLREEIGFARDYIDLQMMLMPERLNVAFDVDANAWRAKVPRMILQPLVENAIVHGIATGSASGLILIRARVHDARLELQLENDVGGGVRSASSGIGLANARDRLQMLYGERQSLSFDLRNGKAVVSVALPWVAVSDV